LSHVLYKRMSRSRRKHPPHELGRCGEDLAEGLLCRKKYRIICRGYRAGRGEIDIVALDGRTLVFVEVKTRRSCRYGLPEEYVTPQKQAQIRKTALRFLLSQKVPHEDCRFDVIGVTWDRRSPPGITHYINAFP
jgi:putative endonuclease